MTQQELEQLARDNLTIEIRVINRAGEVLGSRAFSGAGSDEPAGYAPRVEPCGSYANAEVAATQHENEMRWESARASRGWIVDRIYS